MVDTRQKRFSMIRLARPWMGSLPVPDGDIASADRRMLVFAYSGFGTASGGPDFTRSMTRHLTRGLTRPITR